MNTRHAAGAPRSERTAKLERRAPATPEELDAVLQSAADGVEQQACLRFVRVLLQPFDPADRLSFWVRPRDSLRGQTPLQALSECQLHRVQAAAEAFASA